MGASKTILVIEDERSLYEAITTKLQNHGFKVLRATSADIGLQLLEQEHIDVIWLDHYLLGPKSGLDFVATVMASEKWKNIPIYLVSNTASPDKVQSYLSQGVKKFFVKSDHALNEIISEVESELK